MLTYYINSMNNGMNPQPNERYRELQQARIDEQWENTSAKFTVVEQKEIGSNTYNEVEVWINYVVGQGSTGLKIVPLYSNVYRNLLKCWKTLRALMLKQKDEKCLDVYA